MDGLVVGLWLITGSFYGLFCGNSMSHLASRIKGVVAWF